MHMLLTMLAAGISLIHVCMHILDPSREEAAPQRARVSLLRWRRIWRRTRASCIWRRTRASAPLHASARFVCERGRVYVSVCEVLRVRAEWEHLGTWAQTGSRVHHGGNELSETVRHSRQGACLSRTKADELKASWRQSLV